MNPKPCAPQVPDSDAEWMCVLNPDPLRRSCLDPEEAPHLGDTTQSHPGHVRRWVFDAFFSMLCMAINIFAQASGI